MEIFKDIELVYLALLINKKVLVISDLHLGYEEHLRKKGVLIPRFQFKDIKNRLELILKETKPEIIIITGDLKHEFGTISDQEWRDILSLFDILSEHTKKIILIKGNHDTILNIIAKKRNLKVKDLYKLKDTLILHGDHMVDLNKIKTIIIGHEHPAVMLKRGVRSELYKCFLKGKFKGRNLIVMPSFNSLSIGSDIRKRGLGPFIKNKDFEVFVVVDDKSYYFGKLKEL